MPSTIVGNGLADEQLAILQRGSGITFGGFGGEDLGEQLRLCGEREPVDGFAVIFHTKHHTVRHHMIHAIDLFDVFDGLVGNLPGRSRRYGEIGFEPGIHQRIDRSLRRRGHHAQTADNRHSHEQGGCGVGRATFRTRNVTLRETPSHGEGLRWQPAEHRARGGHVCRSRHNHADHGQRRANTERPADSDTVERLPRRRTAVTIRGGQSVGETPAQEAQQHHDGAEDATCEDGLFRIDGFVHRLNRRGKRRISRRQGRTDQRHHNADHKADEHVGNGRIGGAGQWHTHIRQTGCDEFDHAPAEPDACERTYQAQQQSLHDHRGEHLQGRSADGTQQRIAAHRLAHDHGERVGDDERADKQCDHRENQNKRLDEAERVLRGFG